jgi:hypothetical protein
MPGDHEESSRMFGVPTGGQSRQQRREPQRVLGFSQDMFAHVDVDFFRGLLHPVKSYRRWSRRRRLGAYAVDDDDTPRRNR